MVEKRYNNLEEKPKQGKVVQMVTMNAKLQTRLRDGVKKFQTILKNAKTKDVNESDTVVIISDILSEVFGYDKYSEITSEHSINKTFCDLAIEIDGKIKILIECKAIGLELKDEHIRQAINYGTGEGIDWVILTNGHQWKIFKILFTKPIEKELTYEFDLLGFDYRKADHLELLYYITRESCSKASSALEEFRMQKQALSKFSIGQLLLSDPMLDSLRKIIKKVSPEIKVKNDTLKSILENEVFKREILEGDKATSIKKKISRTLKTSSKKASSAKVASKADERSNTESPTA